MDKEQKPFKFDVQRIVDCGFMIEEAITPEFEDVHIGYGMNFAYDDNYSWIQIAIRTDFKTSNTGVIFMSGTVATRFGIDNLMGFTDDSGKIAFPDGSLPALFSIAFSHMRAIMAKNVSGSRFMHFIIPVINPNKLFYELLEISKQDNTESAKKTPKKARK